MASKNISDLIFIKWFIGVIFFLIFMIILNYFGFISSFINNDASYITSLIVIIFIYFSIKVGVELFYLRFRYENINILHLKLLNKSQEDILATLRLFEDSKNYDDQTIHTYITSKIQNNSIKENFEYSLISKLNTGWLVADGPIEAWD
jgi:hypothetical protein